MACHGFCWVGLLAIDALGLWQPSNPDRDDALTADRPHRFAADDARRQASHGGARK